MKLRKLTFNKDIKECNPNYSICKPIQSLPNTRKIKITSLKQYNLELNKSNKIYKSHIDSINYTVETKRSLLSIACSPNLPLLLDTKKQKRKKLNFIQQKDKLFNKLYRLPHNLKSKIKKLDDNKNLSLLEHQQKLIDLSGNLGKENLTKVTKEFRNLRFDTEAIKPLPPIDFDSLVEHSRNETIKNRAPKNKISLRDELFNNKNDKKDDWELMMEKEKAHQIHTRLKEDPNILKMYEILPEYLVESLVKKRKK